jgi:hypothetical protein
MQTNASIPEVQVRRARHRLGRSKLLSTPLRQSNAGRSAQSEDVDFLAELLPKCLLGYKCPIHYVSARVQFRIG